MSLSTRSIISLTQFLELQDQDFLSAFLEKHGLSGLPRWSNKTVFDSLRSILESATPDQLSALLEEISRTGGKHQGDYESDLRARVTPKYRYDDRREDLVHCLELDGYRLSEQGLTPVDPTVEDAAPPEDDLSAEVRGSGLPQSDEILEKLSSSTDAFRRSEPDYNACLTNARVALETLAKSIAKARQTTHPSSFQEDKWGQVLAYLRTSGLITKQEEEGVSGVYTFISPGAHRPIGLTEQEMARLGRSLAVSVCYFLIKLYNL